MYCCFGCLSLGEEPSADAPTRFSGTGMRLAIALIVIAQSMIFGLALNLHDDVPAPIRGFTQALILGGTLLVIVLLGGPLLRAAWQELRRGRLTIEALFLLTMAGAMTASLQSHLTGRGAIYYEVVSILLVVYTLGKLIGARSRAVALAGSRAWAGQLDTCRLVDAEGTTRSVPASQVLPGDVVEVNPGETIAVDGVIREGTGFVSEAAVNGEPFPVMRRCGDRVLAGAASHDATFRIEATSTGTERQVDRLLAVVAEARDIPVSLQARADRLGRWFLPFVALVAVGTFAFWALLTDAGMERALFNAMAVLLVACPCVIGLTTPIIIWSALGRLAERGVIVRAAGTVERLAEVDGVMLDKTGTLTEEQFTLLDVATTTTGRERSELLGWLAVIEERCSHPVARAFAQLPRDFAPEQEPRVLSLRAVPGCGVEAEIESGTRHTVRIGTPEWIGNEGLACAHPPHAKTVHVSVDDELAAVAFLAERMRDSSAEAIAGFRQLGLPVELLTGDTAERAAALNLPVRAGLLPADKQAAVEAAKRAGRKPLFVGDGINDASALASAHVGIALSVGTDIAVSAADVTLYHTNLRVLPWAVELSREAVRAARRNMNRALTYNIIGMTLAACGVLHPVAAVLLMVVSSLSLVLSSTRVGEGGCLASQGCALRGANQPGDLAAPGRRAVLHGLAFALQGVMFLLLLTSARHLAAAALLLGGFAVVGGVLAYLWHRWASIPHWLDMCFAMLTLGNLGMLLGWWVDNGCAAIHAGGCCHCVEAMREGTRTEPWMWVGMLLFANAAMLWLPRRPASPGREHALAMYTGGNLGMVLGMVAGGWCAGRFATDSMPVAVAASFLGMTAGMLIGMLLGTWLVEKAVGAARVIRLLPRWFRLGRRTV